MVEMKPYMGLEWDVYDVLYDAESPLFFQDIDDRLGNERAEADIESALEHLLDDGAVWVVKGEYELSPDGREWDGSWR